MVAFYGSLGLGRQHNNSDGDATQIFSCAMAGAGMAPKSRQHFISWPRAQWQILRIRTVDKCRKGIAFIAIAVKYSKSLRSSNQLKWQTAEFLALFSYLPTSPSQPY